MPTYNPGPDDALYFLNSSSSDPDLFDASEDPTGGKKNPNDLPQFHPHAKKGGMLKATRRPTSLKHGSVRVRQC